MKQIIDNIEFCKMCKNQLQKELGFNADEIMLMTTEQNEDEQDNLPYYYLFVYMGKRYRYLFGRLVEDKDD